ncbi:MAG: hypothetical protein LBC74_00525 [Planctomycetaceae bacterium]|jgi:hypothetical protein|nr:hypothetical protein [Planctomycetaceae bacterium]
MKTTQIPLENRQSLTGNFQTVVPLTPHVDLTGNHHLTPITGKSKSSRKRKILTKTATAETNNKINPADNTTPKKQTTVAPITTTTTVGTENMLHNSAEKTKRKRAYVSWPRQLKKKKKYYDTIDITDNNIPFDSDELATLDEFDSIIKTNNRKKQTTTLSRPQKHRRRQIDPTTCERNYSLEEVEFMNAVSEYKRSSGRMFPTCSEILEVLKSLGYEKTIVKVVMQ